MPRGDDRESYAPVSGFTKPRTGVETYRNGSEEREFPPRT